MVSLPGKDKQKGKQTGDATHCLWVCHFLFGLLLERSVFPQRFTWGKLPACRENDAAIG